MPNFGAARCSPSWRRRAPSRSARDAGGPSSTRWRRIFRSGSSGSATAIGMMLNNVLPARAGEPARAYALSRSTPVRLVSRRVRVARRRPAARHDRHVRPHVPGDARPGLPARRRDPEAARCPRTQWAVSPAMIGLTAAMYALVFFPVARAVAVRAARAAHRAEARGEGPRRRVGDHPRPERAAAAQPLRRRVRVDAGALALQRARVLDRLPAFGITVPFSAALFLQGLIAIGVAAPQMPGFFGVFELFGQLGLGLYGVPSDTAVAWAITFHALSFIPITLIGAWYFLRAGLSIGELSGADRAQRRTPTADSSAPDVGGVGAVSARAEPRARSARVAAQAKINLRLRILAREATGYHQLETLFLRLALADDVTVRATDGARSLDVTGEVDRAAARSRRAEPRVARRARRTPTRPAGRPVSRSRSRSASRSAAGSAAGARTPAPSFARSTRSRRARSARARSSPSRRDSAPTCRSSPSTRRTRSAWGRGERMLALPTADGASAARPAALRREHGGGLRLARRGARVREARRARRRRVVAGGARATGRRIAAARHERFRGGRRRAASLIAAIVAAATRPRLRAGADERLGVDRVRRASAQPWRRAAPLRRCDERAGAARAAHAIRRRRRPGGRSGGMSCVRVRASSARIR